ncbi:MAG: ankyrin repeat domain-containing protein [Anaerolineae bacterium]|nr:ankyrin repeat domain-containing protein [Anaerolineae bacterium]
MHFLFKNYPLFCLPLYITFVSCASKMSSGAHVQPDNTHEEHIHSVHEHSEHIEESGLIGAALTGNLDAIKSLLEEGADVNKKGATGTTALIAASTAGHIEIVKFLLQNNADLQVGDHLNRTALAMALHNNHPEVAQVLIDHGADINAIMANGTSILTVASGHGYIEPEFCTEISKFSDIHHQIGVPLPRRLF